MSYKFKLTKQKLVQSDIQSGMKWRSNTASIQLFSKYLSNEILQSTVLIIYS